MAAKNAAVQQAVELQGTIEALKEEVREARHAGTPHGGCTQARSAVQVAGLTMHDICTEMRLSIFEQCIAALSTGLLLCSPSSRATPPPLVPYPLLNPQSLLPPNPAPADAPAGEGAKKVSRLALEKIRRMQLDEEERAKGFTERIATAEREQSEMQVGWAEGKQGRVGR